MFAGGVAGITEHIAMYPVDTIKTRMQALAHPGQQVRRSPPVCAVLAHIGAVPRSMGGTTHGL